MSLQLIQIKSVERPFRLLNKFDFPNLQVYDTPYFYLCQRLSEYFLKLYVANVRKIEYYKDVTIKKGDTVMNTKLVSRINEALRHNEMSKAELSRRTGISPSSLSEYLSGKYEPKQDKIYLISRALNVDPVWLLGFEDEDSEPQKHEEPKVDVKDIINNATFLFDGNDYSLSQSDKDMLTNIIKSVLNGKESK